MRFKAVTLGFVLVGTTLGSAALTLGRARGAAWIGQPLELVVPVQIDPGQAEAALCAEADVFQGDSRQDSSRVQVQVMPTEQPDTVNLKIISAALVDEPVVTVYLRAGCSQKSSRKFVLLADFPNENVTPLNRAGGSVPAPVPLVIPVQTAPLQATAVAPPAQAGSMEGESTKVPVDFSKPSVPAPAQPPKLPANLPANLPTKPLAKASAKEAPKEAPKEAAAKKQSPAKPTEAAKPASPGKPHLRLDPIETLNERVKTLESSTSGAAAPDAAARDSQKVQALQSDLKTLLDQAVKNEASLVALRERLEKAESDRVPMALVYALAALVALCLGALAFLWTRRPKNADWENSAQDHYPPSHADRSATAQPDTPNPQEDVQVDLVDMDDESFDRLMGEPDTGKKKS